MRSHLIFTNIYSTQFAFLFASYSHLLLRSVQLREKIATEGEPQALANVIWACAKVSFKSVELLEAVASQHTRLAKDGKAQVSERASEPTNLCAAPNPLGARSAQELSNICWAFAKFDYKADALFSAVAGEHSRIVGCGNMQSICNTCWAFAIVGYKAEALFEAVAAQHEQIAGGERARETPETPLFRCAWLGRRKNPLFEPH